MRQNKKGFTLAELLIVVAIIAVLVAISIPIFSNQLEKSRQATDLANIRSVYAQVMSDAITDTPPVNEGGTVYSTPLKKTREWTPENLAVLTSLFGTNMDSDPVSGGTAWVEYYVEDKVDVVYLKYKGGDGASGSVTLSAGQTIAQEKVKATQNASDTDKASVELMQKAYASAIDTTKAYIEEHKDSARSGLAQDNSYRKGMNYRVYLMNDQGELIPEGSSGDVKHSDYKSSIPKMSTSGKVNIDGKDYTWTAGQSVQIAYRENGNVEVNIIGSNGDGMWGN